ncbi:NlpC/P60 family protein [Streptobacillus felis]|uniref:NlpC/P60 family protein n=1 Tax=Streptobacillus felis TaxID=1384509 RepID=UPI000834AF80|nr:NlpC/P60 family protein [Streptobacillus felis]
MKKYILILMIFMIGIIGFSAPTREEIVRAAQIEASKGYKYGYGSKGENGLIDCSGFISNTFKRVGIDSMVDSKGYANSGRAKDVGSVRPGDLIYMPPKTPNGPSHIMMVVSNNPLKVADSAGGIGSSVRNVNLEKLKEIGAIGIDYDSIISGVKGNKLTYNNNNVDWSTGSTDGSSGNYGSSSLINYAPSVEYDWDGFATTLSLLMENGLKKLEKVGITILSLLFAIQLVVDLYTVYATFNLIEFSKKFFKRLLTFSLYLFAIKKIIDGTVFKVVEEMSYNLLQKITDSGGVEKISNIWQIKEKITLNVWTAISEMWGYGSFLPNEFAQDLVVTIILIAIIFFLNLAFFMMMLNLFKALISFKIVLGLSTILLPFGITDTTKEYYNIGKVLSMALNFAVKLISINFIALIITKTLTSNDSILNFAVSDMPSIFSSGFVAYLVLIGVMYHLITRVEINF